MDHKKIKWMIIVAVVLAVVIVPFMIWGERVDAWTAMFVSTAGRKPLLTALTLGGLLASDILLPVPSSIVSTSCGLLLGFVLGSLVSLTGMIISSVVGYWMGFLLGRPAAERLVGAEGLDRFEKMSRKYGLWAILMARPIPVLAEVSVVFAGMSRLSPIRFFVITSVSNLGISLAYAAIGAYSANVNSFLGAFIGATCLPGLLMLWGNRKR